MCSWLISRLICQALNSSHCVCNALILVCLLSRSCSQACTTCQIPQQQRLPLLSRTFYSRLTPSTQGPRGHRFDSAANMSGRLHGVRKIMSDEQPKSPYIHCSNHSLDLALQEISRKSDAMCEVMTFVKDVSNVILESGWKERVHEHRG
ncbi:unnamed protein product [Ixodes pacificus]